MMSVKRILVAYDFSAASQAALKYARELATILDARLYVLHVKERDQPQLPTESTVHPDLELRSGTPGVEIVRYASEHDIDLIVMGTHGRHGAHALTGSVTEKVVHTSPCPVLTLPWWSYALAVKPPRSSGRFPANVHPLGYAEGRLTANTDWLPRRGENC
jgi:nucleotide-binding universal stress UspA family protein